MQSHNDDLYDVDDDGVVTLRVHAQPGAGRTQVTGRHGDAIKVRVATPPTQDRANEALVKAIAEAFSVPATSVALLDGATSRSKRFTLKGVDLDELGRRADELVEDGAPGQGPTRRSARH